MPEDNGKKNPNESYTNKYVTCKNMLLVATVSVMVSMCWCKLIKPFKSYLGKDTVYNFINSLIKESKYCSDVTKRLFNRELVMTNEDNEDFKNSTICWICDNYYIDSDDEVRDHCHITWRCRCPAHRDCNTNLKLNQKIPVLFHNLKIMILIISCKN